MTGSFPAASPTLATAPGADASALENTLTRQAWAEWPFVLPFAGRVFALQAMHPVVSAGLIEHSSLFDDPWGRGRDTIAWGLRIVFTDEPNLVAAELREMHRPIHGRTDDGSRYHAWNPEPWAWIHLTTFEAVLFARRAIGRAFPPDQAQAFYEEWKAGGRAYGVRDQDMPEDVPALLRFIHDKTERDLTATATATRLYHETLAHLPAPPGLPAANAIWPLAGRLASSAAALLLAGSFPTVLRQRMSIRWTPLHEARYQAALLALRLAVTTLPDRLRLFPAARHAATP